MRKLNKKGFTLIEVVVALGLLVMLGGFAITSLSVIPQARMRESAQLIKTEFELARNFGKTHGGDSIFMIQKVEDGVKLMRTAENGRTEEVLLDDKQLEIFYRGVDDDEEFQLGWNDAPNVHNSTIEMRFSQTTGEVLGPNKLVYMILSNGSKNFKFVFQNSTGMMYYDYEVEEEWIVGEEEVDNLIAVEQPMFIYRGDLYETVTVKHTGKSVQPEIKYDARYIKISGEYRAIDPGKYYITFKLKDPFNTYWAGTGGSSTEIVMEWIISN